MENTITQQYLSLSQTAKYLGLSPKTLYEWAVEKKVPGYKVGRVWRFDRDEIDRFVKKGYNTLDKRVEVERGGAI